MRTRLLIALGACILLALLVSGSLFFVVREKGRPSIVDFKAEMRESIHKTGGKRAYAVFKEKYGPKQFSIRHNAAHVFGEMLYDELGFSGISVCDADFNYGCYHGFMTGAIASEGFSSIPKLTEACAQTPVATACEHGIGHGIVEYVGSRHLTAALAACGMTGQKDPVAGCLTGVFMEYNVPIVFTEDGNARVETRPLTDSSNPYDVCPSLDDMYQPACYFSLGQWWRLAVTEDYGMMGEYCAAAPAYQDRCFSGLGNIIAPSAEFRAKKTIEWCSEMPTVTGRRECLIDAVGAISAQSDRIEDARVVCGALPPTDRFRCGV